jgi:integrase
MATLKLTDGLVEAVEPTERDVYLWDTALPRFGVRVTTAGARVYLIQYRAKGGQGEGSKTRRITIGQHDGDLWNVTKARAAARKLLAPVDLGQDPFADRENEREARRQAAEAAARLAREAEERQRDNFKAVAARFIDLAAKTNRTWAETERLLKFGDAEPRQGKRRSGHITKPKAAIGPMQAWADRHIADIRRSDVADLLDAIKKRSPAIARATYAALRGLFAWCVERDLIAISPCEGLTAPARPAARDRVLSDDELRLIWQGSDRVGYPFGPVFKLLMLTGQRRSEVAGMTWAEVDLEAAIWRVPAARTKNGKAHEVDLNAQAVAVLKELPKNGPLLFPARGDGVVRGFSATKRRLDELMEQARRSEAEKTGAAYDPSDTKPWRLHDLRRTAATGMAALAFPPHVVERVLNHISGTQSGLVGVYQRHEYRPERKAALTAWGLHVATVVSGEEPASNVRKLRP